MPRGGNGWWMFFHADVAEVALHFAGILYGGYDDHIARAIGASADIDVEGASKQLRPLVIFDFFAVGGIIGAAACAEAGALFRAEYDFASPFAVGGKDAGVSGEVAVWRRDECCDIFTQFFWR